MARIENNRERLGVFFFKWNIQYNTYAIVKPRESQDIETVLY